MGTEGEYFRAKTHITILKTVKINHIYVCASIINKIGSYEQTAQITPLPPLIPKKSHNYSITTFDALRAFWIGPNRIWVTLL